MGPGSQIAALGVGVLAGRFSLPRLTVYRAWPQVQGIGVYQGTFSLGLYIVSADEVPFMFDPCREADIPQVLSFARRVGATVNPGIGDERPVWDRFRRSLRGPWSV